MNITNLKVGDLLICTNINMSSYLKICEITEVEFVPYDENGAVEAITINYRELFGGCDNWFEVIRTERIKYRDFEFSFKKINCERAY